MRGDIKGGLQSVSHDLLELSYEEHIRPDCCRPGACSMVRTHPNVQLWRAQNTHSAARNRSLEYSTLSDELRSEARVRMDITFRVRFGLDACLRRP